MTSNSYLSSVTFVLINNINFTAAYDFNILVIQVVCLYVCLSWIVFMYLNTLCTCLYVWCRWVPLSWHQHESWPFRSVKWSPISWNTSHSLVHSWSLVGQVHSKILPSSWIMGMSVQVSSQFSHCKEAVLAS